MSGQTLIILSLVFATITAVIAHTKNLRPVWPYFLLGGVVGIIGVVIAICSTPGLPKAPDGMRAVKCPRCNAVGNVPVGDDGYECWRCHASALPPPGWYQDPTDPDADRYWDGRGWQDWVTDKEPS